MREKPGFPAHSAVSWEAWLNAGLRGWRRSADRTHLQPNSLLTGKLTGILAFSGRRDPALRQETPVLQRLFVKFPTKLTGIFLK